MKKYLLVIYVLIPIMAAYTNGANVTGWIEQIEEIVRGKTAAGMDRDAQVHLAKEIQESIPSDFRISEGFHYGWLIGCALASLVITLACVIFLCCCFKCRANRAI